MRTVAIGVVLALAPAAACSIDRAGTAGGDASAADGSAGDSGRRDADGADPIDSEPPSDAPFDGGSDAEVPFVLVPSIPSIDASWACAAPGDLDTGAYTVVVVDTDTGAITSGAGATLRAAGPGVDPGSGIGFAIAPQDFPAPSIAVFSFASLRLAGATTMRATGANALGLLVCGAAVIRGTIDLRGATGGTGHALGGPGGYSGGEGDGRPLGDAALAGGSGGTAGVSDQTASQNESGGGGGGFGGAGGHGGGISDDPGGRGGASAGNPELVPLRGGGGGGGGGGSCLASGGGGGGALYLGASGGVRLETGTATIHAGGGGGEGCPDTSFNGAAGGGAGGGLLIEGPTVLLDVGAMIAANGGGGGAGSAGAAGGTGAAGRPDDMRAAGAASSNGAGGAGGAAGAPNGDDAPDVADGGGGGGGAAGRIRINARMGGVMLLGSTSPTAADLDPFGAPLLTVGNVAP